MSCFVSEFRSGVAAIAPACVAAVPIGLLFGAVAAAKGLSPLETFLMSALVFAGGAQFAAIEQWTTPAAIGALAFSTLLINARHVLMGASLAPKTGTFSSLGRFVGFFAMADENWAMAERRAAATLLTPAYFIGLTAVFYVNWVVWTTLGAVVGPFLGDPALVGADFAFTALFIGLIAGFWKGKATGATIIAAGAAAALVKVTIGAPWHVPAGAIAGIAAAYLLASDETVDA
ncbi:MAG: AzlC family ABC transporter permease [Labrys sp. (in: a-proteobacteria)]|jgi:4-azaleucine resistance transporter AzlC